MATEYGSTNHYWRAYATYSTSSSNTSYSVTLSSFGVHANGGWFNYPDFTGLRKATGKDDKSYSSRRINISSGEKEVFGSDVTFSWDKTTSAADKTITWKVSNSYLGTSSTATINITVPALNKFTITFNKHNSTDNITRTCYYGKSIGSDNWPSNPSKTGYNFLGWYTASSGGTKKTSSSTFTEADTLHAQWEKKTFTITFKNGNDTYATRTCAYGDTVPESSSYGWPSNPSKTGYNFLGWYTASSGGTKKTSSSTFTEADTLYAQWEKKTFTITFMKDGSTYATRTCAYGDTIPESSSSGWPSNPSKTGYNFAGWYTASSGGTKKTSSSTFTAADTLYAQWSPCTMKLYFRPNSGTIADSPHYYADGKIYFKILTDGDGYTWVYSSASSSGPWERFFQTIDTETTYKDLYNVGTFGITRAGYTYDSDSAYRTTDTYGSISVNQGNSSTDSTHAVTTKRLNNGSQITENTWRSLVVNWKPRIYTVTLDKQSGSSGTSTIYVKYNTDWYSDSGATTSISSITKPTRTGYTFNGYYTTSSGGTQIINSSGNIISGHSADFTNNTTLYAHWTINSYTLTLNANGGSIDPYDGYWSGSGTTVTKTKNYNADYGALPDSKITRTGYTLKGWYTASSGGSSVNSSSKMGASNTTIYAQWTERTAELIYNSSGLSGASVPSAVTMKYTTATNLTAGTAPSSYTFNGWANSLANAQAGTRSWTSTGQYKAANVIPTAATIYAIWYGTLSYNANGHGTAPSSQKMYYSGKTTTASAISATGYTFNGWNTAADGTGTSYAASVDIKLSNSYKANTILYAKWQPTIYTITLNKQNGSNASVIYQKYNTGWYSDSGATTPITTITIPTRTNYIFEGYYTTDSGGTQIIDQNGKILAKNSTFNSNTQIYAHWKEEDGVILTLKANGGIIESSVDWIKDSTGATATKTLKKGNQYGNLPISSNEINYNNHLLKGWFTNITNGDKVTAENIINTNTTIYAQWIQIYTKPVIKLKAQRVNSNGNADPLGTNIKCILTINKGSKKSLNNDNTEVSTLPTQFDYKIFVNANTTASQSGTKDYNNNTSFDFLLTGNYPTGTTYNIKIEIKDKYGDSDFSPVQTASDLVNAGNFILDGYYSEQKPRIGIGTSASNEDFNGNTIPNYSTKGIIRINGDTYINGDIYSQQYKVYHEGYKPTYTASQVGAIANSYSTYLSNAFIWANSTTKLGLEATHSDGKKYLLGSNNTHLYFYDDTTGGSGTIWEAYTTLHKPTPSAIGAVPDTRTINNKALNANITLSASDVSAIPNTRAGLNTAINLLEAGDSAASMNDYIIAQYADGGTTNTDYIRRPLNKILTKNNIISGLGYTPVSTSGDTITGALTINSTLTVKSNIYLANYTTFRGYKQDNTNHVRMFYITQNDNLVIGNASDAATYIYGSHVYLGDSSYPTSINGSSIAFNGSSLNNIISITSYTIDIGTINAGAYASGTTDAITYSGYHPKGIIGYNTSGTNYSYVFPYELYLSTRDPGLAKISYGLRATTSSSAVTNYKIVVHILWVKNPI